MTVHAFWRHFAAKTDKLAMHFSSTSRLMHQSVAAHACLAEALLAGTKPVELSRLPVGRGQ